MDLTWLSALIVGAALGFCIGTRRSNSKAVDNDGSIKTQSKGLVEIEKLADILDDFKMVLVVRNDLKMGKGKIAAQCSHATLGLYKKLFRRAPKALNCWEECAQPKVVVKIENEEEMLELQQRAKSLKLPQNSLLCLRVVPVLEASSPNSSQDLPGCTESSWKKDAQNQVGRRMHRINQLYKEEVIWLGVHTYIQVLKKKNSRYKTLLIHLNSALSKHNLSQNL